MQTDDIAAWLTAIWDEDARIAKAAAAQHPGPEWILSEDVVGAAHGGYVACGPYGGDVGEEIGSHIVAHDPASVLARIAADREILTEHTRNAGRCDTCITDVWVEYGDSVVGHHESYCPTVRYLAVPHASRPGYQEAWRP